MKLSLTQGWEQIRLIRIVDFHRCSKLFVMDYFDVGELDFGDDESVIYLMFKDI